MIIDLPDTNTSKVSKQIVELRDKGGAVALGRVLTLVIIAPEGGEEEFINAANDASREHPCRIIVLSAGNPVSSPRLDAQLRVGGDAGASEVIILRSYGELAKRQETLVTALLLPDAPIVAWWAVEAPENPAETVIGQIAQRRITDSSLSPDPIAAFEASAKIYQDGNTDLAWTRTTSWRAQIAASLDQPPYEEVTAVTVHGGNDSPSVPALAGWLALKLQVPVTVNYGDAGTGIVGVELERASGTISLLRPSGDVAKLTFPGRKEEDIPLTHRDLNACLSEELRRLDPDVIFGKVLTQGVTLLRETGLPGASKESLEPAETNETESVSEAPAETVAGSDS